MRLMCDFECDCGLNHEKYVDSETTHLTCSCGAVARRVIGTPTIALDGTSGDFPGAHARWAKIREDNARIKARRNQ